MPFTPHGKHLIAGDWVASDRSFSSEPAHGPAHDFSVGTVDLVNAACEAAEEVKMMQPRSPSSLPSFSRPSSPRCPRRCSPLSSSWPSLA